jgi:hypothetical protein
MRQLDPYFPNLVTEKTLLLAARLSTIPFALIATLIAAYYRSSHSAGATGYLLIVAFDVVLATVVAPLFGAFYCKNPSPRAAFGAIISGALVRIILEFALPKDGFLLLPFNIPEFDDYGSAASANFPPFFDEPAESLWNPEDEPCVQRQFEDYTGVDSLSAFACSVLTFLTIQFLEHRMGRPLFNFPGSEPYNKSGFAPTKGKEVEESDEPEEAAVEPDAEEEIEA